MDDNVFTEMYVTAFHFILHMCWKNFTNNEIFCTEMIMLFLRYSHILSVGQISGIVFLWLVLNTCAFFGVGRPISLKRLN